MSYVFSDPNGPEGTVWPQFDVAQQKYLAIREGDTVEQYPFAKEVNFWREIVPLVLDSIENVHAQGSPFAKKPTDTCDADGNCG